MVFRTPQRAVDDDDIGMGARDAKPFESDSKAEYNSFDIIGALFKSLNAVGFIRRGSAS